MLTLLGSLRKQAILTTTISNSLRFRASNSAYLSRTPSVAGNQSTWTWSGWVKRGKIGASQILFAAGDWFNGGTGPTYATGFGFSATDNFYLFWANSAAITASSASVFRDISSWYHLVCKVSSGIFVAYINNQQILSVSVTGNGAINATSLQYIGEGANNNSYYIDGYLAEINFIDGQALTPASFGKIDSVTGTWVPIQYTGTYGTNGFCLKFADASAATAATIGKDSSGNSNNWTPNGISVTSGATYDSMIDSPTPYADGGNGRGNYAVINPLNKITTATLAAANLQTTSAAAQNIIGSMSMDSGSWYWEIAYSAAIASQIVGVYKTTATTASITPTTSVIGLRFNADSGALDYTVNGSTYTSIATGLTGGGYFPYAGSLTNAKIIYANFGQRPFTYTPPTGFVALNTQNLPTPTIVNPAAHMAATLYTGTGSLLSPTNTVNDISFAPDFVWIKGRSGATDNCLYDRNRGVQNELISNSAAAETTQTFGLTTFNTNGFSVGPLARLNTSASTYVAWQWKAGGVGTNNTNGSITTLVSANTVAGMSIVTWTGSGAVSTIGHGLNAVPKMIIVKNRTNAAATWAVYHSDLTSIEYSLTLNATDAETLTTGIWNSTAPTTTVFSTGTSVRVTSGTMMAYCFAEVAGFSKIGSYTANASTDGPFVYCGFRPRWIMIKNKSLAEASGAWAIIDTARNNINVANINLSAAEASAEFTATSIDILSNGFKLRGLSENGTVGNVHVFAAFAETPFKYALAR